MLDVPNSPNLSPSCSPVDDNDKKQKRTPRKTLVLTIAFRTCGKQKSDRSEKLIPYVKSIVDRGVVIVDNQNRYRNRKYPFRTTLGSLPTGQCIVLTNCPMAPEQISESNTDTETDASSPYYGN
uniref:Uncharacterized protein n=1 Tax=Caenorhabditis japonica TaxID=281687 RepID=A0A8R1DRA0_CAEJA